MDAEGGSQGEEYRARGWGARGTQLGEGCRREDEGEAWCWGRGDGLCLEMFRYVKGVVPIGTLRVGREQ